MDDESFTRCISDSEFPLLPFDVVTSHLETGTFWLSDFNWLEVFSERFLVSCRVVSVFRGDRDNPEVLYLKNFTFIEIDYYGQPFDGSCIAVVSRFSSYPRASNRQSFTFFKIL